MATDNAATLRQVLVELRALRVRIDRQIVLVQRSLRPATGRSAAKRPAKAAKTAKKPASGAAKKRSTARRPLGYVKDRQALAGRVRKQRR